MLSYVWAMTLRHLSTVTCQQTPRSMGLPRQEDWSGLPFPSPGDLPNPEMEPEFPALQGDSLPLSHLESPRILVIFALENLSAYLLCMCVYGHIFTIIFCCYLARVSPHARTPELEFWGSGQGFWSWRLRWQSRLLLTSDLQQRADPSHQKEHTSSWKGPMAAVGAGGCRACAARGRASLQPWVHGSSQYAVLWAMAAPASLLTSVLRHPVWITRAEPACGSSPAQPGSFYLPGTASTQHVWCFTLLSVK